MIRPYIIAGCVALLAAGVLWVRHDAVQSEREAAEMQRLQDAIQTLERIRDADIGIGNADDDLRWLCERAGGGEACSGSPEGTD